RGKAYEESFGRMHYSFDHKGVHFAVLDNVSDPAAVIGDAQIDWLRSDLKPLAADAPIVIFTHRPLFDLYPQWDWSTKDGGRAIDGAQVIQLTAKKFEFSPAVIELRVGVPVVLEVSSLDRKHGFALPDFKIDEQIEAGGVTRIRFVPDRAGSFAFHCSVFCGSGHEDMGGTIVVKP